MKVSDAFTQVIWTRESASVDDLVMSPCFRERTWTGPWVNSSISYSNIDIAINSNQKDANSVSELENITICDGRGAVREGDIQFEISTIAR